MNVFITLNPHIENLSRNKLIKDFRFILQKYYRKVLGPRYYKHKDKQYKIGIFQEDGFSDFIQPHYSYCLKEDNPIITQNDLYERITNFN